MIGDDEDDAPIQSRGKRKKVSLMMIGIKWNTSRTGISVF